MVLALPVSYEALRSLGFVSEGVRAAGEGEAVQGRSWVVCVLGFLTEGLASFNQAPLGCISELWGEAEEAAASIVAEANIPV